MCEAKSAAHSRKNIEQKIKLSDTLTSTIILEGGGGGGLLQYINFMGMCHCFKV